VANLYRYINLSFDFKMNVDANVFNVAWCHLSKTLKPFKEVVNYYVTAVSTNNDETKRLYTEVLLETSFENKESDLKDFQKRLTSRVGDYHQLEKDGQIYFLSCLSGIKLI